ncbi:TPA: ABC transporter permease YxdM, partial [Campylobacter coli]|nr:ABC transporter permease YxdM [Campylobacter coli]
EDEAVYFPGTYDRNFKNKAPDQLKLLNQKGEMSDQKLSVKEVKKPLISLNAIIAVNDQTFDQLKSLGDKASLYGYSYDHWKDSLEISQSLQNEIYGNYIDVHSDFASKAGTYYDTVQLPSLSLFIGLFIAIVFFVAAASFLYFRLFTDLDEDRERYRSLAKIGLSE